MRVPLTPPFTWHNPPYQFNQFTFWRAYASPLFLLVNASKNLEPSTILKLKDDWEIIIQMGEKGVKE